MLKIEQYHAEEMITHSKQENPNECCGILSGTEQKAIKLNRITNIAKSPFRYVMDPKEFLDADLESEKAGLKFVAFYHSHTHSPAYPSETDVRMALQSGYLNVNYILISLENLDQPVIRAFKINESGSVEEEELKIGAS